MPEIEGLARTTSAESGLDDRPRCDPRTLAVNYCGLTLAPWGRTRARLAGGVIWYPAAATEDAQAYLVAHEVGHDLIEYAGMRMDREAEEIAASRIGCALLLPHRAYLRDVRANGWDVPALQALWPLASAWIHARRIAELCEGAVASRWRRGRLLSRTQPGRASVAERELAHAGTATHDRARALPDGTGCTIVVYDLG
jgi:hypothetical protein